MALDSSMQQVVELALGVLPTHHTNPYQVLYQILAYIRVQWNLALHRVERHQGPAEVLNDLYISLKQLADAVDLCNTCADSRMATTIITGICDTEIKKKLLALSPFPTRTWSTHGAVKNPPNQINAL